MADKATEQKIIAGSIEDCWAVVTDLERYPEWISNMKEVRVLSRDSEGRAQEVSFRAAAFGRSTSYTLKYDYSKAPKVLSWVWLAGDITNKLDGKYTFEPADGGTLVSYELEAELKVPLPGFVKRRAETSIIHTALSELKARVEASAKKK